MGLTKALISNIVKCALEYFFEDNLNTRNVEASPVILFIIKQDTSLPSVE